MNELDRYRPDPSWFAHNPKGIHGLGHAARVLVWANRVGTCLQEVDIEAVRWAAVLHDVGRLSDGWDKGHGARSAEWVAAHRRLLSPAVDDDAMERIIACCRYHETPDQDIANFIPELVCIKDADGLDRVRINDLDEKYLRTECARLLVGDAWNLYRLTAEAREPWEAVLEAAQK
jgi:hypothetical protein